MDKKKKVLIMSAKFAPGHFSHLLAYYCLFERLDYEVSLYLAQEYEPFVLREKKYRYSIIDKRIKRIDILFIYNLSKDDIKHITRLKKENPDIKIYYVYHEPWLGFKKVIYNMLAQKESVYDTVKTVGRYCFAIPVLKNCEYVFLPSKNAEQNYKKYCLRYNSNYGVFPLIFTDEAMEETDIKQKKYFSFISTAENAKNFRAFLEYVKFRSKRNPQSLFQIATRTDITEYLDDELAQMVEEEKLILNHAHPLTNDEINEAYKKSNCVWLLYNRSTQSGVLCKSFMFGTPVIASDIGSFGDIVTGGNGIILKTEYNFDDIDAAYETILSDLASYSKNARQTFLNNFYWKKHIKQFKETIEK
ncbi:MAG: glycosyltransferase [Clostridiales bacterium]|nr:glycosyltransferase [Clostridiales bacterium]